MLLERRSKEAEICRDQLPQPRRLLAIKLFPPVEAAGNLADEQVGCAPRRELSEGELAQLFPMVAVVEAACKEEPPITLSPGVGSRS